MSSVTQFQVASKGLLELGHLAAEQVPGTKAQRSFDSHHLRMLADVCSCLESVAYKRRKDPHHRRQVLPGLLVAKIVLGVGSTRVEDIDRRYSRSDGLRLRLHLRVHSLPPGNVSFVTLIWWD